MTMPEPIRVEPREGHRIYVEYDDGTRGEVDLSHRVGQTVYKIWDEPGVFEQVHIVDGYAIGWSDELELCPDAVYFQLTGKTPEEMMPGLRDWHREGAFDGSQSQDARDGV